MSAGLDLHFDVHLDEASAWRAVQARDRSMDGRFVYAVRTTGVYCRPSCPSRRPARGNVEFHADPGAAEAAGFRACKRCRPQAEDGSAGEAKIAAAQRYLADHADERITLPRLAAAVGMSPSHLQRTFKRLVGVSPKAFHDAVRSARFKAELRRGEAVTSATYAAGYGSGSRVYERAGAELGMSPGRYRDGGRGVAIRWTLCDCALGRLLVAVSRRGLCTVAIGDDDERLADDLRAEFPHAERVRVEPTDLPVVTHVRELAAGRTPAADLVLDLSGTTWQRRVWEAIRRIPRGETRSYADVAADLGHPGAARAVARACAANRLALAVPCHRITRSDGSPGGYRWGQTRKRVLLDTEAGTRRAERKRRTG
jgi:AraC family transcriptional regulator of adaptative response/methylated-DNA-[protein]-cysteine methyltransferase